MSKCYGQFCALARALDHVGDRWTLLIVRELLLGPKRYGELLEALPGVATNLLADRLRALAEAGLVERGDGRDRPYALTALGRGLEPTVLALIRWGAVWMTDGPGTDHVDHRWGVLVLRAMLSGPTPRAPTGELELRIGDADAAVVAISRSGRSVRPGAAEAARAIVRAPLAELFGAAFGGAALPSSAVHGDADFARTALTPA